VKILVVDDEPDFLATCVRLLALMGHEAVTAAHGFDALSLIDRGGLDLVITDLRMAQLDGEAVVRHARRATPALPVIVVTGHPSPAVASMAREAGAVLLPKPIMPAELRAAIDRAIAG
jgi:DNA-binding NtrC family response regulator